MRRGLTLARGLWAAGLCLLLAGMIGAAWSLRAFLRAPEFKPAVSALQFTLSQNRDGADSGRIWLPLVGNGAEKTTSKEEEFPAEVGERGEILEDVFGSYLSNGEKVVVRISAPPEVNGGKEIKIAFTPGERCEYGMRRACVSRHADGRVTLLTLHSGLGGEGEAFRAAVEGTGLDLAFFPLWQIQHNLSALGGAAARITTGGQGRDDLRLTGVVRVPPGELKDYFASPFDEALARAAEGSTELHAALESGKALLLFEICGWQLPGEPWAEGVTPTTASIYLGVIEAK